MVRKLFEILLGFLVILAALPLLYEAVRWAEPRLMPVVVDAQFNQEVDGSWTATFNKVRNCALDDVFWFNGKTWVAQGFETTGFSRPLGVAEIEGWPLPPNINPDVDISVARHICHPLWRTTTPFTSPN